MASFHFRFWILDFGLGQRKLISRSAGPCSIRSQRLSLRAHSIINPKFKIQNAFTLIELLVVIAIIAILAAILFPVFARARDKARQAGCFNNMKQISTGLNLYAQDWDETYPSSHFGAYLFLARKHISSPHVWRCPSAPAQFYVVYGDHITGKHEIMKTPELPDGQWPNSYAINDEVLSGTFGREERGTLSDVQFPSDTPLLGEADFDQDGADVAEHRVSPKQEPQSVGAAANKWDTSGWCSHVKKGSLSKLHPWHVGGANFGYVDGHAKWHKAVPPLYKWMPQRPPGYAKS